MRRTTLFCTAAFFVLAVLFAGSVKQPPSSDSFLSTQYQCQSQNDFHRNPPVAVCFDEGTDPTYMAEVQRRIWGARSLDFNTSNRWTQTATDGATGGQGDGVTLTYSFVPDGLMIEQQPSTLFSTLTSQFGSQEAWQTQFASIFARWSELSGNTYIRVEDDGAGWGFSNPGELGARGDVRIGMINIDGPSNVLAYNYYPNIGDMVIDASEEWGNSSGDFRFFKNVVAHEHGHGLGLAHVCPNNATKLMEPIYSSARPGPQHDDIRAIQRLYGDYYEPNDNVESAYDLGTIQDSLFHHYCSLDDNSDVDYYRFSVPGNMALTVTLIPVGEVYLDGQQLDNGDCEAGTEIDSRDDNNLDLELLNGTGTTVLASSVNHPAGQTEEIFRYILPSTSSDFMLLIDGASANAVQLYDLEIRLIDPATPIMSGCPLAFGEVELGETFSLTASIFNPEEGNTLAISSITADGPFTVSQTTPVSANPGATIFIEVTFHADEVGEQEGVLTIEHDGPGGVMICELTGKTVSVDLNFLTGTAVDFGEVEMLSTDSVRVAFRAVGNTNLIIESIAVEGENFSIHFPAPQSIVPGPLYSMYPRFTPYTEAVYNGNLIITHSGTTSPDTISLTGIGTLLDADIPAAPVEFALDQNYPNPFNPSTRISFTLPYSSHATLQLFDIEGRLVRTLVDQGMTMGSHSVELNAQTLAAGVYLYRLRAGERSDVRKMILLK